MDDARGGPRRLVALGLVLGLLCTGCAVSGLEFLPDRSVRIVEPREGRAHRLPLDVRWEASSPPHRWAVFFDASPMRPGQTLRSLVPLGDPCLADAGCPDEKWLADRNVYVSSATRLTVQQLPDFRGENRSRDQHEVSIVRLDERGARVGESVFVREFEIHRAG